MPSYERINDARQAQKEDQLRVKEIADAQAQRQGYTRAQGFEPAPRPHNPYVPEAARPPAPEVEPYQPQAHSLASDMEKEGVVAKPQTQRRVFGISEGD